MSHERTIHVHPWRSTHAIRNYTVVQHWRGVHTRAHTHTNALGACGRHLHMHFWAQSWTRCNLTEFTASFMSLSAGKLRPHWMGKHLSRPLTWETLCGHLGKMSFCSLFVFAKHYGHGMHHPKISADCALRCAFQTAGCTEYSSFRHSVDMRPVEGLPFLRMCFVLLMAMLSFQPLYIV